ncbi:small multi-drug export protein [Ruminococcaceae bacterium OttesenSCG-928-N02]|nr:small multi-drug export protein [Ruminococcaceae bacterium OttesenSCG-928-N02]
MNELKKYLWVGFISMLPIIELRGAIPIGVGMGLPVLPTYIIAVLCNMIPVPFILLFAPPVLRWCTKIPKVGGIFTWIENKGVKAKAKLEEKVGFYQYVALCTFVAIPLPGTGAWTGSLGAALLKLDFWKAVLAVMLGVLFAGVIMGVTSVGVLNLF